MAASAQYSVTVRVELDARQEPLGKLTAEIAEAALAHAGGDRQLLGELLGIFIDD